MIVWIWKILGIATGLGVGMWLYPEHLGALQTLAIGGAIALSFYRTWIASTACEAIGEHLFRWGYFQAFAAIWLSAAMLLTVELPAFVAAPIGSDDWYFSSGAMQLYVLLIACGYWVVKVRSNTAWVVLTLLTLNPILWVVNGIYGWRRRHDNRKMQAIKATLRAERLHEDAGGE